MKKPEQMTMQELCKEMKLETKKAGQTIKKLTDSSQLTKAKFVEICKRGDDLQIEAFKRAGINLGIGGFVEVKI